MVSWWQQSRDVDIRRTGMEWFERCPYPYVPKTNGFLGPGSLLFLVKTLDKRVWWFLGQNYSLEKKSGKNNSDSMCKGTCSAFPDINAWTSQKCHENHFLCTWGRESLPPLSSHTSAFFYLQSYQKPILAFDAHRGAWLTRFGPKVLQALDLLTLKSDSARAHRAKRADGRRRRRDKDAFPLMTKCVVTRSIW